MVVQADREDGTYPFESTCSEPAFPIFDSYLFLLDGSANSYELKIRSLTSINGVITVTESGLMYSFNENFVHELVGRQLSSEKAVVVCFHGQLLHKSMQTVKP